MVFAQLMPAIQLFVKYHVKYDKPDEPDKAINFTNDFMTYLKCIYTFNDFKI